MSASLPRVLVLPLTLAALLGAAPTARADCVDGVRPPTAGETEFIQRAQAALVAGLPEAVRPIERRSANRPDPVVRSGLTMCRGTPVGAFGASTADGFVYRFTPEEANARSQQRRELLRQVEALEKLPPEKEAQRKELETQMRAAYAAAPTRSRKDPPFTPEQQAQVDRAQVEGRRLEEAMRRVEFEHRASVKPQADPLRARADELQQGPQIFTVALGMNAKTFEPLAPGRGQRITFGTPSPKQSASLQPVNIVVTVEGPAGPARDALAGLIDRDYLAGLIGKPLPDVATSHKRIESNVARAAAAPPLSVASSVPLGAAGATPPSGESAAPAAGTATAAAAAATTGAAAGAAASTPRAAAPAGTTAQAPCPPPNRTASASNDAQRTGSQVGGEVGGAVLGGGWGRSVGSAVGGALGALGGSKPQQAPPQQPADCPR
ncbi:MAG: hypothetical protein ING39_13345 [Burkholderiales bacterium]|jgi:hypothetical protein|nr:hypothetical protein [Burkholderiales bacterium]